jgi:hypothetical protein
MSLSCAVDLRQASAPLALLDLLQQIDQRVSQNRGREPEGLFPSCVVDEVMRVQTSKWPYVARDAAEQCWLLVRNFVEEALIHVAPPHIADTITRNVIDTALQESSVRLQRKIQELLKPYTRRHVFIMNTDQLLTRVKKAASDRKEAMEIILSENDQTRSSLQQASTVLDYVDSQYDIALDAFLENFANLAVEDCLIDDLENLFNADVVASMDATQIQELTAEPAEVVQKRADTEERLERLQKILRVCRKHVDRLGEWERL